MKILIMMAVLIISLSLNASPVKWSKEKIGKKDNIRQVQKPWPWGKYKHRKFEI